MRMRKMNIRELLLLANNEGNLKKFSENSQVDSISYGMSDLHWKHETKKSGMWHKVDLMW